MLWVGVVLHNEAGRPGKTYERKPLKPRWKRDQLGERDDGISDLNKHYELPYIRQLTCGASFNFPILSGIHLKRIKHATPFLYRSV